MPPGRPRLPGTEEERAANRREKVRRNVRALRSRRREQQASLSESSSYGDSQVVAQEPCMTLDTETQSQQRISVILTLEGESPRWSINFPLRIDAGPSHRDAFLASFLQRSLPETATGSEPIGETEYVHVSLCCSTWVTTACFRAGCQNSEMLSDALLASALTVAGEERGDKEMLSYGLQVQARAFKQLREQIGYAQGDKRKQNSNLLAATTLACAMSELLSNKSWQNFSLHIAGVGALIEAAGPSALTISAARDNFYGYRAIQSAFSFVDRRSSFLARAEWIHFPWRDSHPLSDSPMHAMLDIAYKIPSEMQLYDQTVPRSPQFLRLLLQRLASIASDLEAWKRSLFQDQPTPTFRPHATLSRSLNLDLIEFCNVAVASAFTFYTGVRIALLDLVREVSTDLAPFDPTAHITHSDAMKNMLQWSRSTCQCVEYFFNVDKKVVGKLICLFPLDAAWKAFKTVHDLGEEDLSLELAWCKNAAEKFEAMGLPALRSW
jgi:hypothetical protein